MSSLESNAMLCKVSIKLWTNESIDNESAQELATAHKVEKYAKVRRIHLPEYCLDRIRHIAGDIRNYHSFNTLPFLDRGIRLLPSTNYFDYIQGLSKRKEEFDTAVNEFITQLPIYIAEAKQKFGDKFDESYIPSVEALRSCFSVEPTFMPIAHSNDWRIQLEESTLAALRERYNADLERIQSEATQQLWATLKEGVEHFITKLETPKARIHESLIPNLFDRAKVVQRLNTTNDEGIVDITTRIINMLDGIDTHSVKTLDSLKEEVLVVSKGIRETINAH